MCGEHDTTCTRSPRDTGSSPHVRGAHSTRPSAHCRTGIIPACAGSTLKVSGRLRFAWDYPRMCGEHIVANRNCGSVQGSSPHVRGARAGRARPAGPSGIIPACAGSTLTPATSRCTSGDHPRMCGEHGTPFSSSLSLMGSSPHVRGARRDMDPVQPAAGIIPACAGSTTGSPGRAHSRRDHPRMCGEHTKELAIGECTVGSSPHVRGARHSSHGYARFNRDHPRMCGEHRNIIACICVSLGSSPHVRGAQKHCRHRRGVPGIIPACAGSTQVRLRRRPWTEDHPRMCGEHRSGFNALFFLTGSSPHVRGARKDSPLRRCHSGIIPACAGSTLAVS